jgi:hypothetical protein
MPAERHHQINDCPEWEPKHLRIFPDLTRRSDNHPPDRMDRQGRRCQHLAGYVLRHWEETVGRLRSGCLLSRQRQSLRTETLPKRVRRHELLCVLVPGHACTEVVLLLMPQNFDNFIVQRDAGQY